MGDSYPVRVFDTADTIITTLFMFVILVYVISTVLFLTLPMLNNSPKKLKITLFVLVIIGGCALILKYATDYNKYVILALLIGYSIFYAVFLAIAITRHKRVDKIADSIIERRQKHQDELKRQAESYNNFLKSSGDKGDE